MPDVGVLELKIRDNAETAAGGLDQLSGALNKVRQACAGALGLDNVASEVVKLAQTVQNAKGTSTIVRNLGTMFNAISKFSNIKKFSINSDEIRKAAQSMLLWADARDKFNEVAQSGAGVTDWRMGMGEIVDSTKKTVDEVKSETTELTKELTHFQQIIGKTTSIQIFGKKKQVPGQSARDRDGTAQKIQEVVSKISVTDAAATSIADKIEDTGKKFASAISAETITSPLEKISDTFRNMTTNIRYYGSALDTVIPKVQALSSVEMIEAGNARFAAMSEREQMLVMAEATGKIKSIKEMNTNDVFVGMEQTTERIDQMNISLRETGDIVESVVIPRFQEMYAIWSQWAYEFNAFQMAGSRLMSGNSPMLLGDGRTVGQLLLGDGSEPQTFLSTWVDTGEQFRTNWVMFTSDVAEQWRAQWSPDWILGGWNVPQSMSTFHLGAGTSPLLLGDGGVSQENALSTMVDYSEQWKQNWIYGEGTVSEVVEETERVAAATRDAAKETEAYDEVFQRILDENREAATLAEEIRAKQEAAFYNGDRKHFDFIETNSMADNLTQLDLLKAKLHEAELEYNKLVNNFGAGSSKAIKKGLEVQRLRDAIWEYTNSLRGMKEEEESAEASTKSLRDRLDELFQVGKKGTFGKLLSQFARIAKYRFLRAVIRQITQGFREGVENVYYYSKAVGTSFAPSMDSAASSLAQMKNSLGAAVAPALQALIPIMQTVVNWFITGLNYLNQFFALLNGQNTWTRALPKTTEAFKKQETAAKKTGAAIKDLLADWDELNIIQSNTSGAGKMAGTSEAEDYLSMFEEVDTFDNKVKEIVTFIKDNFDTIKTVALAIGEALLAWKVAEGIYDVLRLVGTLKGGIIMSVVGFTLSAAAGKDLAVEGFSAKSVLEAIGGLVASALGGAWIGKALLASAGFGATGLLIGAITGLTIGLAFLVTNFNAHAAENAYGTIAEDAKTIRKNVMKYFKTNVEAEVNVTDAWINNTASAEKKVGEALAVLEKDYAVAVTLNTGDAYETFKKDVNALIAETNLLIKQRKQNIKVPIIISGQFGDEAQPLYNSLSNQLDLTEQYIKQLGEKIGQLISSGITDGVELEGLKQKLTDIVRAITYGQVSGEFAGNVELAGAKLRNNEYTKDTVEAYYNTYKTERQNLWDQAAAAAISEKADLGATVAAIRERMKQGDPTATVEALADAIYAYNTYDTAARTKQIFEEWVGEGDKVFGEDMRLALSAVMQRNTDQGRRDNILKMVEKGGASSIVSAIYKDISSETGFSIEFLQDLVKTTGIDLMSLFPDDFAKQVREAMIYRLQHSDYTPEQNQAFLNALGIELTPSELIHMTFPGGFNFGNEQTNVVASNAAEAAKDAAEASKDAAEAINNEVHIFYTAPSELEEQYRSSNVVEASGKEPETEAYWQHWSDSEFEEWNKGPSLGDMVKDWLANLPFTYKPPEYDVDAVFENAQFNIIEDENLKDLREKIEGMMDTFGYINYAQRVALEATYGKDLVNQVLEEYNYNRELDQSGMTTLQRMAASGTLMRESGGMGKSDVGWMHQTVGSVFASQAESDADMQSNISSGTEKGTQDMLSVLRDLLSVAQAINRKEFSVTITPTSTLGAAMTRSVGMYDRITG